jgi:hypothetical protein
MNASALRASCTLAEGISDGRMVELPHLPQRRGMIAIWRSGGTGVEVLQKKWPRILGPAAWLEEVCSEWL